MIYNRATRTILVATLLIAACISVCSEITDGAEIQGRGGYISRADFVVFYNYTNYWQGYYGVIVANTSPVYNSSFNESVPGISTIRKLELGANVREGAYLLITASPSPPNLSSLRAGNISKIDAITGLGDESGTKTFTNTSSYRIPYTGGTILTDVPTVYTFVEGEQQFNYFKEGLLEDENGTIVFAVPIYGSPVRGYDSDSYYFQFMLPNNRSNPLTYYMFYLPSDLPLDSAGGSGGGGGGGGGGGAISEEPYSNIEMWEIREEYLQANLSTCYLFRTPDLAIYEVCITPAKSLGLVSVKIEQLKGLSMMKGVTQPHGIIYVHANIWVNAKELQRRDNIKKAIIRFKIDNKWLADNNLYDSKLRLLRWNESKWIPLETQLNKRDRNYSYYEAKTDAFGHFAISFDPVSKAVPIYPIDIPPPEITATPTLIETPPQKIAGPKFNLGGYAGLALILIGILLYRLLSNKPK